MGFHIDRSILDTSGASLDSLVFSSTLIRYLAGRTRLTSKVISIYSKGKFAAKSILAGPKAVVT